MSFWDRRLQEIKGQPQRPAYPGSTGIPAPAARSRDELPGYVQQQLAIRGTGGGAQEGADNLARRILREGYNARPPSWVQRQPRDTCPNCAGPDMAAVSSGGYSRPGAPGTILRCFDCGWSSARGIPAMYGIPASGPVVGAAVQSRDGQVPLRNTGLITA